MSNEVEVGKTYRVKHKRKGTFTMKVTGIHGEWITGTTGENYTAYAGDSEITVRDSLATFTEVE